MRSKAIWLGLIILLGTAPALVSFGRSQDPDQEDVRGVRVDPNHDFHKGDRVRVLLETNSDGHLYIFNTTDNGAPVMIYPDPQLDEAGNFLQAHVPFEIPSSVSAQERLRWLTFDEQ